MHFICFLDFLLVYLFVQVGYCLSVIPSLYFSKGSMWNLAPVVIGSPISSRVLIIFHNTDQHEDVVCTGFSDPLRQLAVEEGGIFPF